MRAFLWSIFAGPLRYSEDLASRAGLPRLAIWRDGVSEKELRTFLDRHFARMGFDHYQDGVCEVRLMTEQPHGAITRHLPLLVVGVIAPGHIRTLVLGRREKVLYGVGLTLDVRGDRLQALE